MKYFQEDVIGKIGDKLYAVSADIVQTVDALDLIKDSLWSERNVVAKEPTAETAEFLCGRLERYFSAYGMLFNRLLTIANTLEDMASNPLSGLSYLYITSDSLSEEVTHGQGSHTGSGHQGA